MQQELILCAQKCFGSNSPVCYPHLLRPSTSLKPIFRKIGNAPHLSLDQMPSAPTPEPATAPSRPMSMAGSTASLPGRQPRQQRPYSIAERVGSNAAASNNNTNGTSRPDIAATMPADARLGAGGADELGQFTGPATPNGFSPQKPGLRPGQTGSYMTPPQIPEESEPASSIHAGQDTSETSAGNNPPPPRPQARYAVVNGDESVAGSVGQSYMSALQEKKMLQQSMADQDDPSASGSGPQDGHPGMGVGGRPIKGWLSAEQEKQKQQDQTRRYQEAKKVAEDIQSAAVASLQSSVRAMPFLNSIDL